LAKYPELRKLMAAMPKPMTKGELAKIIGKSTASVSEKLNGKTDFKFSEVKKITEYFRQFKPELTSDIIFSDVEVLTIVNEKSKST